MKKIIITSILVVGLSAGYAFAYGNGFGNKGGKGNHMMGKGRGYCSMMDNAGFKNRSQGPRWMLQNDAMSSEERQQFLDATVELRKKMHEKRFELREAARSENISPAELAKIEKEMIGIRTKIHEQALTVQKSMK